MRGSMARAYGKPTILRLWLRGLHARGVGGGGKLALQARRRSALAKSAAGGVDNGSSPVERASMLS